MIAALLTLGLVLAFCFGGGILIVGLGLCVILIITFFIEPSDTGFMWALIGALVIFLFFYLPRPEPYIMTKSEKLERAITEGKHNYLYKRCPFPAHSPVKDTPHDDLIKHRINSYETTLKTSQEYQKIYQETIEYENMVMQEIDKLMKLRVVNVENKIPIIKAIWENPKRDWYNEFYHDLYIFDTRGIKRLWNNLSLKFKNTKFTKVTVCFTKSFLKKVKTIKDKLPTYYINSQK